MCRLVTDYIEKNSAEFTDKIIFADEDMALTSRELCDKSKRIATNIIKREIFKSPIAVYMDKSPKCIVAFMGCAYSGNFYTPIDTSMPIYRTKNILDVLEPAVIICDKKYRDTISEINNGSLVMIYEELMECTFNDAIIKSVTSKIIDSDALYIIFTSGSMGVPKGVVVSHKSVISYAKWVTNTFNIDESTIFGNQTPFYFSMSVLDIFATIVAGSTMYLIPKKLFSFPVRLLEYIAEKNINTIYWVPSVLCLVANLKALGTRNISCLKKVLFAGEVMPTKQLNMWLKELPDVFFANLYGPTEATDICTYYVIDRQLADSEPVPIGHACVNTDVFILDDNNKKVNSIGKIGELCIRGTTLAYGYYNNYSKTNQSFVQNPLNKYYPEIIYRTGDFVKLNEYNEFIYCGRKDALIKHMGYRIELGEIETAISSLKGIQSCCCIYNDSAKQIVLFYVGRVEEGDIMDKVNDMLPSYMVPNVIIQLDNIPLNDNGKINRKKIKNNYLEGEYSGK